MTATAADINKNEDVDSFVATEPEDLSPLGCSKTVGVAGSDGKSAAAVVVIPWKERKNYSRACLVALAKALAYQDSHPFVRARWR